MKRRRLAIFAGAAAAGVVALFATCGGCGLWGSSKRAPRPGDSASASASVAASAGPPPAGVASERLWELAQEGEEEDLATLAVHEGAAGLVEGAARAEQRLTAVRAMAHARGWAQLPYLADAASGKDDTLATAALDSIVDLAARPRTSEDPEDAAELALGCERLLALARATERGKARRVPAIRALRMMPCPKSELPSDLDAR